MGAARLGGIAVPAQESHAWKGAFEGLLNFFSPQTKVAHAIALALWANAHRGVLAIAVVTEEQALSGMIGQGYVALFTHRHISTFATENTAGRATSVEIEDRLLFAGQDLCDGPL